MTKDEAIQGGARLNFRTLPTLRQHNEQFSTEQACREHFQNIRWPNGVQCPRCQNPNVRPVKRAWSWQCRACNKNGYRFSLTTGTIFENTKYPLREWFQVMYLMLQSKKGMSALQIHRTIGSGDYRTAWYMCHRIRAAFQSDEIMKLQGVVEIDETYVGGENRNKPLGKRTKTKTKKPGGGLNQKNTDKITVIGAISRKGNVICQVIERLDTETVGAFVDKAVSNKVELVATDEAPIYSFMEESGWSEGRLALRHESVNHHKDEYVRGIVHTGTIDGFWSLLKRGIMGSFHHVSKQYLPLYLNEFSFRHNHRRNTSVFDHAL